MIVSHLIKDALTELGVVNPTDTPQPQESEFAKRYLNRILDFYNTQNLMINFKKELTFSSTDEEGGTWKPCIVISAEEDAEGYADVIHDGDNVTHRLIQVVHPTLLKSDFREVPIGITDVFWRQNGTDYYCTPMTHRQFNSVAYKNAKAIPRRYYKEVISRSSIKLCFEYAPLDNLELHIVAKIPYSAIRDFELNDDIDVAFGFEKCLLYRLAFEIADSYGITNVQNLYMKMQEAEDKYKASTFEPSTLKADRTVSTRSKYGDVRNNRGMY